MPLIPRQDAAHLIEEQLVRHAAPRREAGAEALLEGAQIRAGDQADPEQPRVAEGDQQGVADAPRETAVGEVHLGLVARGRLEAHDRRGGGPELLHIGPRLRRPAGVAGRAALGEQPTRLQGGKLGEPRLDQGVIGGQFGGARQLGAVAGRQGLERLVEPPGGQPAVQGRTADTCASGGLAAGAAGLG